MAGSVGTLGRVLLPSLTAARTQRFSTAAEAREALGHVAEAERRQEGRLDRNRDGTMKLSFAIAGPGYLDTVNKLLYATYHPSEPLTRHLGLYKGLNSVRDVDKMVERKLVKNLTLVAYDESGRPVGAAVNNALHKEELEMTLEEELEGIEDPRYRPIQALHHQLRQENRGVYQEIGTHKLFDMGMIGVEEESRGQGVATNLIRRSILLAGCLGFRAIKTEATGKFSRAAFSTVGMHTAGSIKYADFEYRGEKIFAGISAEDTEITFMKKKFFQSALKHIL